MLFSYKLLSSLVDLNNINVKELVDKLTFSGFEVENYHPLAYGDHLVVGKVIKCEKHPDSDHLHLLKVDVGNEILDIVCGAKNVKEGIKVIIAKDGANLKAISKVIKAGYILNHVSNGMCCSLVELGVEKSLLSLEDQTGIHILDDDAKVGDENVLEYLGLDDYILDINILPNRPDCLSHLGLAREISCLFKRDFISIPSFDFKKENSNYQIINETDKCDLFNFIELDLNEYKKTPKKIVQFLRACGIKSINLLVDIGNFSMLLSGQPVHMYDLDKVQGKKLYVSDNKEGEFVGLDEKIYKLEKGDITISDENGLICLAGVLGSKKVEVDENSKHIGIELAHFYHASIRHTSTRLGLASDSSSLFVKGVNPYLNEEAISLIMNIFNTEKIDYTYKGYSSFSTIKELQGSYSFSLAKLNSRLGSSFTLDFIKDILNQYHLSYDILPTGEGKIFLNKYRLDLLEQCDIEEEVYRNNIDSSNYKSDISKMPVIYQNLSLEQTNVKRIENTLVNLGLSQIISFTLISEKMDKSLRVFDDKVSYKLLNPLTNDHEYVRSDLLSSIYEVIEYNLARKRGDMALFEVSDVNLSSNEYKKYLSFGLVGFKHSQELIDAKKYDFFDAKGIFESIMNTLGLDEKRYTLVPTKNKNFHPYKAADVLIGKKLVGTFGHLSPMYFKEDMVLGELDLTYLFTQRVSKLKCKPLSNLQEVRRDLAFKILDENVSFAKLLDAIRKSGGKYIQDVKIFDVFKKDGELSYAISLYLAKEDKSFTDEELNQLLNKIISEVTNKLKVELKN